jgi:hypothetical protein
MRYEKMRIIKGKSKIYGLNNQKDEAAVYRRL